MKATLSRPVDEWASALCSMLSQQGIHPTCIHVTVLRKGKRTGGWIEEFSSSAIAAQLAEMTHSVIGEDAVIEIVAGHAERSILHEGAVRLPKQIERGLTGLAIRYAGQTTRVCPSLMRDRNKNFPEAFEALAHTVFGNGAFPDAGPAEAGMPEVVAFSTCQFLIPSLNACTGPIPVYRGKSVVALEEVTFDRVSMLARSLAGWMARHVADDGKLTYSYRPSEDVCAPNTNRIREFMGSIALFKMAQYFRDAHMQLLAEKNLRFNIDAYYRDENAYGIIVEGGKVKLGAAALAALAIRQSGHRDGYQRQSTRLMHLTETMWNRSGEFRTFLRPQNLNGSCQNFYPGETLLFWAEQWIATREPRLWKKIEASFRYYQAWHRGNRNPAFVPWHTQACYLLWTATGDARFRDFILEMNDWLVPFQQWDAMAGFPDAQGRFHDPEKPYGPPHASSTGVYLEGLIDAFRVASQTGDRGRARRYALTIRRGLRNVMQLQFAEPFECAGLPNDEKTLGGVRTTEYNNVIRVDNVQHNLMAILKILQTDDFLWEL